MGAYLKPSRKEHPFMTDTKYIGLDVHKESISIAVRNAAGKLVMECVIETKANVILDFIHGLRGELQVTFEEGTWATWLYDLLKPHVRKLVVCDPRKNSRQGNKNDRINACELADRLYMNKLSSVYHGGAGVRTLKELSWLVRRCVLRAPNLTVDPRPSRTTRKSYGPRVPDRTMVAKFDRVLLCWFRNGQASSRRSDENRWQRKPQSLGQSVQQPSTWRGRSKQILLNQVGCEARKSPAVAGVFFLDFPFYRGGLNGSTQHSGRTQLALKTKAKIAR